MRGGISLRDDVSDILVQAQRASHVAVHNAAPVIHVLLAQRNIETVSMTRRRDVGGRRAFAQHLLYGIAGHQMDQQKDHRHHQPHDRQHVEQAGEQVAQHQWATGSCRRGLRLRLRGLDLDALHAQPVHADDRVAPAFVLEAVAGAGNLLQLRQHEAGEGFEAFVARQAQYGIAIPDREC